MHQVGWTLTVFFKLVDFQTNFRYNFIIILQYGGEKKLKKNVTLKDVAKLAGVPDGVVNRAKEILRETEVGDAPERKRPAREPEEDSGQLSLLAGADNELIQQLKALDVNTLTPIEALNTLYELKKLLT